MTIPHDGLYVHRLLQAVVREGLDAEAQQAWVAVAVRLLRAAFPIDSDEVVNWPECERLLHHVIAVANHGQRLDVAAEGWLRLVHQAAVYLWSRGRYQQALTLHEQAVAASRRLLGNDNPDTLATMNDLDAVCHELGNHSHCSTVAPGELVMLADWRGDPDERLDGPGTEVGQVLAGLVRRAWRCGACCPDLDLPSPRRAGG